MPLVIVALALVIPLFVDGYTQQWKWRLSNNSLRLATGISFGLGAQLLTLWAATALKTYIF